MAVLKMKDVKAMSKEDREKKLKELQIELIKSKSGRENKIRPKEIKKAIARILTLKEKITK